MTCHGPQGEGWGETFDKQWTPGVLAPPLNPELRAKQGLPPLTEDVALRTIYLGRGAMPAWGSDAGGPLDGIQLRNVVRFIIRWDADLLEKLEKEKETRQGH